MNRRARRNATGDLVHDAASILEDSGDTRRRCIAAGTEVQLPLSERVTRQLQRIVAVLSYSVGNGFLSG
jgi:hypothetical protein